MGWACTNRKACGRRLRVLNRLESSFGFCSLKNYLRIVTYLQKYESVFENIEGLLKCKSSLWIKLI